MSIHKNYLKLTAEEKEFVDLQFRMMMKVAKNEEIPLNTSDGAERAVEAVAKWVVESRPKPQAHTPHGDAITALEAAYGSETIIDYDFRIDLWTKNVYRAIPWSVRAREWAKDYGYSNTPIDIYKNALEGFLDNLRFLGFTFNEKY